MPVTLAAGPERLVERPEGVGVEVVHHQHDSFGVGVVDGEHVVDLVGPVDVVDLIVELVGDL